MSGSTSPVHSSPLLQREFQDCDYEMTKCQGRLQNHINRRIFFALNNLNTSITVNNRVNYGHGQQEEC